MTEGGNIKVRRTRGWVLEIEGVMNFGGFEIIFVELKDETVALVTEGGNIKMRRTRKLTGADDFRFS